jgi:hypothetical protein
MAECPGFQNLPHLTEVNVPGVAKVSPTPHFSPQEEGGCRKGGALQAAEKPYNAVILSAAKDLALSIFKAMRDSSSPLLLRMTVAASFSAACLAPPLQGVLIISKSRTPRSLQPQAARGAGQIEGGSRDFGGAEAPPFQHRPKVVRSPA